MALEKTEKEWLTTGDTSRLMGVSKDTVRRWIDSGILPSAIYGQTRRVRRVDAEAYLNSAIERGKGKSTATHSTQEST